MSQHTLIPWAHHTFNVAWGCQRVSEGCGLCYAEALAKRRYPDRHLWGAPKRTSRLTFGEKHWQAPRTWNRWAEKAGVRHRVFCSSMADVFEAHPTIEAEREKLWPLIRATPHLDWLLLTKRPERILDCIPSDWGAGYPNVWLGTSAENEDYADVRGGQLWEVPAAVRFLSCEPLLGPLILGEYALGLDWVIVGGESGNGRRPMDLRWAYELKAQCEAAGVAFFFKQRSSYRPNDTSGVPADLLVREFPTLSPEPTV